MKRGSKEMSKSTKMIIAVVVIVILAVASVGYIISQLPQSHPSTSTPTATPIATAFATPTPTATTSLTPTTSPALTTATFDFDTGTPSISAGAPTPFDQTNNGVTAHFSSPTDFPSKPAFSVQSRGSLGSIASVINSTLFLGNFLWPNTVNQDKLDIKFSRSITSITMVFKTVEYNDPGVGGTGSTIRLTAYLDSTSNVVGSPTTKNGIETAMDIYPEGILAFNSGGQPFNLVRIDLPPSAQGASGFIIDSIEVT